MIPPRRTRANSRDKILDAAAEIVGEIGAGKLTLDAVAQRAGLSKGGLLYNFPSKDALLSGMLERMIGESVAEKEALRGRMAGARNLEARLSIAVSLKMRAGAAQEVASGMLAALAENPGLLDPVRTLIAEEWRVIKATSEDPEAAMLAWLAVEALGSLDMHGVSPVTAADRARIEAAVTRLLDHGIKGDG
ncbi:TetR family transcriptional regulator [Alsobacter metallidurans]|uniref:TetR family transcriptional regulator n=1 Tax=Alsobacter metallidurans TaxID=340221 RepID=A0A917MGA1_9HYPH|nr:TetR/AcrR family transcriptional regulator [Alsobacter metallidurans]GGH08948.1 TetR family transcriptional regulator [Alsobacter metallidurans]